uniref:Uncharacterized protein n=1 Tax=Amphimedon queenslandica TaxID=400682 RepID=A0A1X7U2I4_AMPQE
MIEKLHQCQNQHTQSWYLFIVASSLDSFDLYDESDIWRASLEHVLIKPAIEGLHGGLLSIIREEVIREQFSECTILTVAHRLNTVMDYDKIMCAC